MSTLPILHDNKELVFKSARDLLEQILPAALHGSIDDILAQPEQKMAELEAQLLEKIPTEYRFLLHKIKDLSPSKLSVLDISQEHALNQDIGLTLGGSMALNFRQVEDADYSVAEQQLVGLGVVGNYNFGSSAKLAKSLLSVGVNAAHGNTFQLEYVASYPDDAYVMQSLLNLEQLWFDPSSLGDVVQHLADTPLWRFTRSGVSTATLGLEVGIARSFAAAYPEAGIDLSASAGVSLAVEFNDRADFTLSVESSSNGYVLELEKTRKKESSSVLTLGVDVKLVGLRNRVLEKISAALPEGEEIQQFLSRVDGYVDKLGTDYLLPRLKQQLESRWPEAAPAIAVIVGDKTTEELAEEIRGELSDKLQDVLANGVDLVNARVVPTADAVAAHVVMELGLPAGASSKLQGYLRDSLGAAIEELQEHLADGVDELLPNDQVQHFLQPLGFLGGAVSQLLGQVEAGVQAPIQERLDAIKAIYQRYLNFRKGVITAVKEKMEENFAISVVHKKQRTKTQSQALRVEFRELAEPIAELYQLLWNGDLRELRTLTDALKPLPNVTVSGEYQQTMERLNDTQLNLSIFGLKLSAGKVFADKVAVGFDLNGKLIVAESEASLKKTGSFLGEQQSIHAEWDIDYLSELQLVPPVYVTMEVLDNKFQRGEIESFFGPLEAAGVMRAGVGEDAENTLFPAKQKSIKNATLKLKLPVPWAAWRSLLEQLSPADAAEQYLRVATITGKGRIRYVKKAMAENGYPDSPAGMHAFLLAIGRLPSIKKARSKFVINQTGSMPRKISESYTVGRVIYRLQTYLAAAQLSWQTALDSVAAGADKELINNNLGQFNEDFAQVFSGIVKVAITNPGKSNWMTAAAFKFLMDLNEQEDVNPFMSCTVAGESRDAVVIS